MKPDCIVVITQNLPASNSTFTDSPFYYPSNIPLCAGRRLLKIEAALPETPKESAKDLLLRITGIDLSHCPACHRGTMIVVAELPPILSPSQWDSS